MMKHPVYQELRDIFVRAQKAHHIYEKNHLRGEPDKNWSGFYTAYTLGSCGEFMNPDVLSRLLEQVPPGENWVSEAAERVFSEIGHERIHATGDSTVESLYICPRCFYVSETAGNCRLCGTPLYEFKTGDENDPCRCPVIGSDGEILTHAPLWWIRCVAPGVLKSKKNR